MKNLGNLSPKLGSIQRKKRLGRGIGSGLGKTAGKGHKGQKARKSGGIAPGFEGGQTPMYRRLPKRGFTVDSVRWNIVSLEKLNNFADGTVVDRKLLEEKGIIKSNKLPIKILKNGALEKKITLKVDKCSKGVKECVLKVGGKVVEEV